MKIYNKSWKYLIFSILNILFFLLVNVVNKKIQNYKIYPIDISFSIIIGGIYGFVLIYLLDLYLDQQQEAEKLDFEVQASLEQLEAFNEELVAQNTELEDFAKIISDKEKELKEIIDLSPMQIFLKDSEGAYLLCNKAHADFLEMSENQVLGTNQSKINFFTKEQLEKYKKTDKKVIEEHMMYEYMEKVFKNNKTYYLKIYKIPIQLSNDLMEILVIAQDITDLKLLEIEIEKKNKILKDDNEELKRLNDETNRLADNFEKIIKIITDALEVNSNEEYLIRIFNLAINLIKKVDMGSVYLFEEERLRFLSGKNYDLDYLNDLKLKKEKLKMPSRNEVIVEYNNKDFINISFHESLRIGFYYGNKMLGGMNLNCLNYDNKFSKKDIRLLKSIGILVNNHLANSHILEIQHNTQNSIIISLVKMLELFDQYTKGHSEEVAELSQKLAIKMGIKNSYDAYWAGMVHDIGKILVDRKILNKKGKLTDYEYDQIKMHPLWGYQVLNKSEGLKDIAKYVLYHHERYDGNGYPKGLKGEEIPKISQVITVVDAWHTMRSKRSYKDPLSYEEAKNELLYNRNKQFSKEVVEVFIKEILLDEISK